MSESFDGDLPKGESSDAIASGLCNVEDGIKTISVRGTEDGLVLRIDGRANWKEVSLDLESYLEKRKEFLKGASVSIEWLDRLPTKDQTKELERFLKKTYSIEVLAPKKREFKARKKERPKPKNASPIPLFSEEAKIKTIDLEIDDKGYERVKEEISIEARSRGDLVGDEIREDSGLFPEGGEKEYIDRMTKLLGDELFYDEDANAKTVFGTLRSGQRIETPYSLVVIGDVNPGADLIAGGDILVFGSLRGTAHAGAYDEESLDKIIVALKMQPMQLRIGSVISRGNDEVVDGAEIARIEDRRIVVQIFNSRAGFSSRTRGRV